MYVRDQMGGMLRFSAVDEIWKSRIPARETEVKRRRYDLAPRRLILPLRYPISARVIAAEATSAPQAIWLTTTAGGIRN